MFQNNPKLSLSDPFPLTDIIEAANHIWNVNRLTTTPLQTMTEEQVRMKLQIPKKKKKWLNLTEGAEEVEERDQGQTFKTEVLHLHTLMPLQKTPKT